MPAIAQALSQLRVHPQPLRVVAHNACRMAGLDVQHTPHPSLSKAFFKVVDAVESEGARLAKQGHELAYHNRAHAADAITALACLLAASADISETDRWLSMIAMAGHDFGHQGKTNQQLGLSQEVVTAAWLQSQVAEHLTPQQISRITSWVVGTDPACVEANHGAYAASPKDVDLHLQVLINEADIAASLTPELALGLTRQLMQERGLDHQDDTQVMALYQAFSAQVQLSSPAALQWQAQEPGVFDQAKHQHSAKREQKEHRERNELDEHGTAFFNASFPAAPESVGQARAAVMQALAQLSVSDPSKIDIEIALGEVLQNIVRHANFAASSVRKFDIQAWRRGADLVLRISDSATPLVNTQFLRKKHTASESGGMGLGFILKIALKYDIFPLNDGNLHHLEFSQVLPVA
jgi:anti-sigma regulatory factor (Ser/Thr protein kinase)